jgi:hypothetical protein
VDRFDFYRKWLVAVGALLVVFGVAMALASGTALFRPILGLIDPAFWPHGSADPGTVEFRAWVYGVWGATIAGWGIAVVFVAAQAFARREPWAWHGIALGTALWFVLDTGISLAHGVVINAAFNAVVLVLVVVPLGGTRRLFR